MTVAPPLVSPMEAEGAAATLRTTRAIRERCGQLLARARAGHSRWFTVEDGALATAAREVADVTRTRYPKGAIPVHGRWRHLEAGGVDRRGELERLMAALPRTARSHALIDLTFVSACERAVRGRAAICRSSSARRSTPPASRWRQRPWTGMAPLG